MKLLSLIIGNKALCTAPLPVVFCCARGVHPAVIAKAQNILHGQDGKAGSGGVSKVDHLLVKG